MLDNQELCIGKITKPRVIANYSYGNFINIISSESELIIQQDFYGLNSLFLYQDGIRFAISNSLLLLINYLRINGIGLTLNYTYLATFPYTWTSLYYGRTIIEEIEHVPSTYMLKIDKVTRTVEKIKGRRTVKSIPLDSIKGMSLLDAWHQKWHNLIASIANYKYSHLSESISGGRDSRTALSIVFDNNCPPLNLSRINFNSYTHSSRREDLEIAQQIGDRLGFKINLEYKAPPRINLTIFMSFAISLMTKMSIHNQMNFRLYRLKEWAFHVGGNGGEFSRKHWEDDAGKFISQLINGVPLNIKDHMLKMFDESIQGILDDNVAGPSIPYKIYHACRGRNHFGRFMNEGFLTGYIDLMPLLDPMLASINTSSNPDLLFAIIIDRYLNPIKDINFDSGHSFSPEIWKMADDLNVKYPEPDHCVNEYINIIDTTFPEPANAPYSPNPALYMFKILNSDHCRQVLSPLYPHVNWEQIYNSFFGDIFSLDAKATAMFSAYIAILASQTGLDAGCDEVVKELLEIGRTW